MVPLSLRIAEAMASEGIELPDKVKIAPTHTIADTLNITHDSIDAGNVTHMFGFHSVNSICDMNTEGSSTPSRFVPSTPPPKKDQRGTKVQKLLGRKPERLEAFKTVKLEVLAWLKGPPRESWSDISTQPEWTIPLIHRIQ